MEVPVLAESQLRQLSLEMNLDPGMLRGLAGSTGKGTFFGGAEESTTDRARWPLVKGSLSSSRPGAGPTCSKVDSPSTSGTLAKPTKPMFISGADSSAATGTKAAGASMALGGGGVSDGGCVQNELGKNGASGVRPNSRSAWLSSTWTPLPKTSGQCSKLGCWALLKWNCLRFSSRPCMLAGTIFIIRDPGPIFQRPPRIIA
mmetsp:Transcript_102634/g.260702  ORF Transcript_102634/g.260702 Transcript_102634/m.260702 type:complete len:202 (-) Transcript_102634:300-905(-)